MTNWSQVPCTTTLQSPAHARANQGFPHATWQQCGTCVPQPSPKAPPTASSADAQTKSKCPPHVLCPTDRECYAALKKILQTLKIQEESNVPHSIV